MLCKFCGREVPDHSVFCLTCGKEIDRTDLSEADITHESTQPMTPDTNNESPLAEPITTLEKGGWIEKLRGHKALVAIGVAVLAICLVAGVKGLGKDNQDKEIPVIPTEMSETIEPTETTEETAVQGVKSYEKAMETYKNMDYTIFDELPRVERLPYAQYLIDLTVSRGNYDSTYGEGMNAHDYAVEYTPVSKDNTGQEILDNYAFMSQISLLQVAEGTEKPYDRSDGEKVLSAVFMEVGENIMLSNEYIMFKAHEESMAKIEGLAYKKTAIETSELLDGVDNEGNAVLCKTIKFHDVNDSTYYARFFYIEYTSYDDTQQAVWLLDFVSATAEGLSQG